MKSKKAFTLIELVIAISIIVILSVLSYAPYNYYSNKAKLKIVSKEVSQLLYEARNRAVNGSVWSSWNVSIWVYFDTSVNWNYKAKLLSFPHDIDNWDISYFESWNIKLIKTLEFKNWIYLSDIEGRDNILFFFDSITWDLKYYTWNLWVKNTISDDKLDLNFSYKHSSSPNLNKTITYISSTNIIDY